MLSRRANVNQPLDHCAPVSPLWGTRYVITPQLHAAWAKKTKSMFKKTIAAGLACTLPFFYACSSDDEGPEQEAGSLSANTTAIQAGDDCGTNGGTLIELVDEEGETVAKI